MSQVEVPHPASPAPVGPAAEVAADDSQTDVTGDTQSPHSAAEQAAADDEVLHAKLSQTQYAGDLDVLENNTPTKSKQNSAVWKVIKRLPESEYENYPKKTHVCVVPGPGGKPCCTLMRLSKYPKTSADDQPGCVRSWQTSLANTHLRLNHASSVAGIASSKRKSEEADKKELKMFEQGMNMSKGNLSRYTLTNDERALTSQVRCYDMLAAHWRMLFNISHAANSLDSQARWYIYSRMHISKREFESDEFREMIREQSGGRGVYLSQPQLKEWVRAEFNIFLIFLKYAVGIKMDEALGNPFAQAIHDGGTLSNHVKYQACGLQFISEKGDTNLVVCLGLVKSTRNTDVDIASLFKNVCKERTRFDFSQLCMAAVQDRAAKGVSAQLNLEEEVCEMHDTDKIGQAATGALTRSRNKKVINPFVEGVQLMKVARAMATHFSYSTRREELYACVVKDSDGNTVEQPQIKFSIDLNGTRVAAQHGLLYSALRLNRSVKVYAAQTSPTWALTEVQWQSLAEVEGVLDITKTMSTLSQSESAFLGAYGPVLKSMTLKRLRRPELMVIDTAAVARNKVLLTRKVVAEDDLSDVGRTALARARLEAERRWCGNDTEEADNISTPTMADRERIAILLDLRTLKANGFTAEAFTEAEKLLEDLYVSFAKRAMQYEKDKEATAAAAAMQSQLHQDAGTPARKPPRRLELASGFEYDESLFDDSDEAESPVVADQTAALKAEFKSAFKAWKKLKVDWRSYFPEANLPSDVPHFDLVKHLMPLSMGSLYKKLMKTDPLRLAYGWLPRMALCSRGQIGTLLAESFCERILSQANLVMVDGNTLLSDEELEMVVVLRMNRNFMRYMRQNYNHLSKQDFAQTVIRVES